MQKRKIKRLDQSATNGLGKAQATAKAGRKGYLSKSRKASSQRRRRNEQANAGKNQRKDSRRPVFKLSDHLSEEIIEKLRVIKEEIENGSGEANRN